MKFLPGKRAVMVLLVMALCAAPAMANVYSFSESGFIGLLPVSANAEFTTGAGFVDIKVWNTVVDQTSGQQSISDLAFILSNGALNTDVTGFTSSGLERTITTPPPNDDPNNGTFVDGAHVTTGWGIDAYTGGIKLNVLGHLAPPFHLIVGLPNSGSGLYDNANASIGGENPQLFGTELDPVLFHLLVTGVTADTAVNFVQFSYGTNGAVVPIPPSVLLMGSGLLGLGLVGWRRREKKA
jgi:hypothetical protein